MIHLIMDSDDIVVNGTRRVRERRLTDEQLTADLYDYEHKTLDDEPSFSEVWDEDAKEWRRVYCSYRKEAIDEQVRRAGFTDETKEHNLTIAPTGLDYRGTGIDLTNIPVGPQRNCRIGNVIHVTGVHIQGRVYTRTSQTVYSQLCYGGYWQMYLVTLPGLLSSYPNWDTYWLSQPNSYLWKNLNGNYRSPPCVSPFEQWTYAWKDAFWPVYSGNVIRFSPLWRKHGAMASNISGSDAYVWRHSSVESESYFEHMIVKASIPCDVRTVITNQATGGVSGSIWLCLVGAGLQEITVSGEIAIPINPAGACRSMFHGAITVTYTDE